MLSHFLYNDDIYDSNSILENVAKAFQSDECLYGLYEDFVDIPKNDTSKVLRYWKSRKEENNVQK